LDHIKNLVLLNRKIEATIRLYPMEKEDDHYKAYFTMETIQN